MTGGGFDAIGGTMTADSTPQSADVGIHRTASCPGSADSNPCRTLLAFAALDQCGDEAVTVTASTQNTASLSRTARALLFEERAFGTNGFGLFISLRWRCCFEVVYF